MRNHEFKLKLLRTLNRLLYRLIFSIIVFLWAFSPPVNAAPKSLTYQGRIVKADGTGLEYNSVSFVFQITDPTGQCVIYQEQVDGINMTNSGGVFDVAIGNGTVHFPLSPTPSILDAFNNSSSFSCGSCSSANGSYSCTAGTSTYTPVVDDIRKLRVSFYDGTGWKVITPDNTIRSVPFAAYSMSAQKLGTNVASDFLLKAGLPTCGAGTFLTWNGTALTCAAVSGASGGTVTAVTSSNSYLSVATGTSTPALTVNVGTIAGTVAAGDDSRIAGAFQSSTSLGGDLTGTLPNPSVSKINGVAVSSAVVGDDGKFLRFINGSGWQPQFVKLSELKNSTGVASAFNVGTCTAAQTLVWSSITDQFSCQDISLPVAQITGVLSIANGGTGANTANGALNALVPAQAGNSGKFLTTDGSNTSWAASSSQWTTSGSNIYYNSGNVGIGTTAPAAVLDVLGTSAGTGSVSASKVLNIVGGAGGTTGGNGGGVSITGGNATVYTGGVGGSLSFTAGNGSNGGNVIFTSGTAIFAGTGSSIALSGGNSGGGAGTVTIASGNGGNGAAPGGPININAGNGSGGGPAQNGGPINITAGGGANGGSGASVTINGGAKNGAGSDGNVVLANLRGSVGIGTTSPRAGLDVNSTILAKPATSNATSTIDFSAGNLQYTTSDCGAFQLNNLKDGGTYMFSVQGAVSATCSFTAFSDAGVTALTVHMPPDHGATTTNKHTIYNLVVMGTHLYVAWTPGY